MGGFGMGRMGGFGMGHMGGMGVGRMGGFNRSFNGFGGVGFFPGFFGGFGYGLGYGGYGYGYPYYGYGYGDPYYGYGGYGYPYGFGGYGYGYPYGYGGYGYGDPYSGVAYSSPLAGFGYSSAYMAPAAGAVNEAVAPVGGRGRYLGISEEPVVDASGKRGIKVGKVYPGTAAEKAGLQVGDVIHQINGYLTEQRGNLAWIIANAAPANALKMSVRTVRDGQEHEITAQLP
jgi:membrane-associated protease RseP (regulator of RpoE activity)